jgi:hypothetical protein
LRLVSPGSIDVLLPSAGETFCGSRSVCRPTTSDPRLEPSRANEGVLIAPGGFVKESATALPFINSLLLCFVYSQLSF